MFGGQRAETRLKHFLLTYNPEDPVFRSLCQVLFVSIYTYMLLDVAQYRQPWYRFIPRQQLIVSVDRQTILVQVIIRAIIPKVIAMDNLWKRPKRSNDCNKL